MRRLSLKSPNGASTSGQTAILARGGGARSELPKSAGFLIRQDATNLITQRSRALVGMPGGSTRFSANSGTLVEKRVRAQAKLDTASFSGF